MERQLEAYCAHLRNERQVSEHTLLAYRRDLDKVIEYCNSQGIAGWGALQIQQLRQLIARQHHQASPRAAWRGCCRPFAACTATSIAKACASTTRPAA